jgi:hypothetical protein
MGSKTMDKVVLVKKVTTRRTPGKAKSPKATVKAQVSTRETSNPAKNAKNTTGPLNGHKAKPLTTALNMSTSTR